jgi:hypothetical protein
MLENGEQMINKTGNKVISPRVATILNKRLDELNMTRSDFIRAFHKKNGELGSRNHLFKILNGGAVIGEQGLLPAVCKLLELDFDEVLKALRSDKIEAKDWAQAIPKANKTQTEVVTLMDTLSKRDQEDVLLYVRMRAGKR